MRCILNVPHNPDACDDHCVKDCDKMEFEWVRFFEYNYHEYIVFIPLCRMPTINRTNSATLMLAVDAMEREINCKIITKNEVREIIQEFDDCIDINQTQFSEYHDRSRSLEVKPVYSTGLGNCPYQLFVRRDVMIWINNKLIINSINKWGNKEEKPVNYAECEICNQLIPSHFLEIVQARTMINFYKDALTVCPQCKKEVLPQEKEARKHFDITEANSILNRLIPKDREILECHDQQRRAREEIRQARRQFVSLKHHLKENNLEALRSLAEELKPPPTSPT